MGVSGLWKLLEGTGRPVTLESLEGKIVAVDISIWLNMAVKGMRDLHGHASNNAHLVTLFNRICKLLHFGIKPVFVFDGQTPLLKLKTVRERREKKNLHLQDSKAASEKIMQNYLKREVLKLAIKTQQKSTKSGPSTEGESTGEAEPSESSLFNSLDKNVQNALKNDTTHNSDDLYVLPPMKDGLQLSSSDEEQETNWNIRSSTRDALYGAAMSGQFEDILSVDVESEDFKNLPPDLQHEMLTDIKEIRKRRRTVLETMPEKSETFSSYQLTGLLAKHKLSNKIRAVEKEMGDRGTATMAELALSEAYEADNIAASKISSEEATHYILIEGLKNKVNKNDEIKSSQTDVAAQKAQTSNSISTNNDEICGKSSTSTSDREIQTIEEPLNDKQDQPTQQVKQILATDKHELVEKNTKAEPLNEEIAETSTSPTLNVHNTSSNVPSNESLGEIDSPDKGQDTAIAIMPSTVQSVVYREGESQRHGEVESLGTEIVPTTVTDKKESTDTDLARHKTQNEDHISTNYKVYEQVNHHKVVDNASEDKIVVNSSDSESEDFVEVEVPEVLDEKPSNTPLLQIASEDEPMAELIPGSADIPVAAPEPNPWAGLHKDQLHELGDEMDREDKALLERMQASARAARDVSDSATSECQELLQLFGIPFIVSPQEAEAQCAFLNKKGLTAGTITEDSDIWPFGGSVVYKDVFDRKRDPKCYTLADVKTELGLEQPHFINIALLSGSDYTAGIEGVGPVRALEIMKEFPGEGMESMEKFKRWWSDAHAEVKKVKETKMKGQLRKLTLPSSFPSRVVVNAYLEPSVNQSLESFSWGVPDLDGIRSFANLRLQWTRKKIDDDLLPILKRAADRKSNSQTTITTFFTQISPTKQRKHKSKRVRRAVRSVLEEQEGVSKQTAKKTTASRGGRKRRGAKTQAQPTVKSPKVKEENLGLSESSGSDS